MFKAKVSRPDKNRQRRLKIESLEVRRVLASSVGWDGPGQGTAELSYYIGETPGTLSRSETVAAIETALDAWSSVIDVNFTATPLPQLDDSLDISFTTIDGPGGTLARAYFPDDINRSQIAGDIRFDATENWEVGNSRGSRAFDLVWVAAHEIGHALGIHHLDQPGSVLAPSVSSSRSFNGLTDADIAAARQLYSAKNPSKPEISADDSHHVSPPPTLNPPVDTSEETSKPPKQKFASTDVNHDNRTNVTDALLIINAIRRATAGSGRTQAVYDTNGDGRVSMSDVIHVINVVKSGAASGDLRKASTTSAKPELTSTAQADQTESPSIESVDHPDDEPVVQRHHRCLQTFIPSPTDRMYGRSETNEQFTGEAVDRVFANWGARRKVRLLGTTSLSVDRTSAFGPARSRPSSRSL